MRRSTYRCEPLEPRHLLAAFIVNGTGGADIIHMGLLGPNIVVTVNAVPFTAVDALTDSVTINGLGGADTIAVKSTGQRAGVTVTLNAGSGNDLIQIGDAASPPALLVNCPQHIVVDGGSETDSLGFVDTAETRANTYTADNTAFSTSLAGFGGADYANIEGLTIFAGQSDDHIVATSTVLGRWLNLDPQSGSNQVEVRAAGGDVTVHGGAGPDSVQLGSMTGGGLNTLKGAFTFNESSGAGGSDSLTLHDETNVLDDTYTITSSTFSRTNAADLPLTGFDAVDVHGGTGNKVFFVNELVSSKRLNLFGGDDVWIANSTGNASNVTGPISIVGFSRLYWDDDDNSELVNYTITSTTIARTNSTTVTYSDVHEVNFYATQGANTFNFDSTEPISYYAYGNDGNDTFNVGHWNFRQEISPFTSVILSGQGGADSINLNDINPGDIDVWKLSATSAYKTRFDIDTTFTSGIVDFDLSYESLVLNGSPWGSGVICYSTYAPTTLNLGDGDDSVNIGYGDLDANILGPVQVLGQGGNDTVYFDDRNDTTGYRWHVSPTLLTKNSSTFPYLALTPAMAWETTESIQLDCSGGNDTVNMLGTASGVSTVVQGNDGNDLVTFGAAFSVSGTPDLNTIQGPVGVDGGAGSDSIVANDSSSAYASFYTFPQPSAPLQRLGMADITAVTPIASFTLNAATGSNTININRSPTTTTGNLIVNAGDGNDTINQGLDIGWLTNISGHLTINGQNGFDNLYVNNSSHPADTGFTLTSASITNSIGQSDIGYGTLEQIQLDAGPGNNMITVNSNASGTPMTFNGQGGNDTFNIGGGSWQANCPGSITIDGGTQVSADVLNLSDAGATLATVYNLQSGSTTLGNPVIRTVTYTNVEQHTLDAGQGPDSISVNSTAAGTDVRVNGNGGDDQIQILDNAIGRVVTVDGGTGLDGLTMNADGVGTSGAQFVTSQDINLDLRPGSTLNVVAGGNKLVSGTFLQLLGSAVLDLNDNDLILDYSGPSHLAAVQALINQARSGGVWTGSGLTSTAARNAALHNTTLGAMEASDFKAIYGNGATFNGQAIDTTAVLVKYTYYGDADFNGKVNFDDYVRTDSGFNNHRTGWTNGDFDGNDQVNFDDYVRIDLAFNTQAGVL
jgi:hypothetical protein